MRLAKQAVMMLLLNEGGLDDIEPEQIQEFEEAFLRHLDTSAADIIKTITDEKAISDELKAKIQGSLLEPFVYVLKAINKLRWAALSQGKLREKGFL